MPLQNSILSLRGQFIANDPLLVTDYHANKSLRDLASKIGIFLMGMLWLVALWKKRSRIGKTIRTQHG
ncbi:MAG: hypothetical protein Q3M24_01420 [Candidatus Electrothrix aestuarii]|uniref:Uncharacterized protein n=1 Tax=Candidatus Electrothrix aestuarii TaxID=3062594 RepID=A0AAU8LWG3_9BACT|nr:hypothetical protein [Candidatus Electrothrix aestuarii]